MGWRGEKARVKTNEGIGFLFSFFVKGNKSSAFGHKVENFVFCSEIYLLFWNVH
jgi:hypothetical protein